MSDTMRLPLIIGSREARDAARTAIESGQPFSNSTGSLAGGRYSEVPLRHGGLTDEELDSVGQAEYIITTYRVPLAWAVVDASTGAVVWRFNPRKYSPTSTRHMGIVRSLVG